MNLRRSLALLALLVVLFSPLLTFAQTEDQPAEPPPTTPSEDTPPTDSSEVTVTPTQGADSGGVVFIPLTAIPGVNDVSEADSIAAFLNVLYRLCVGVAATLAVIQIMRGGVKWMQGDSITGKKDARDLIVSSVFGLVLVLSPVLVFSIIDPRILDLKLDASQLQLEGGAALNSSGGEVTEEQEQEIVGQIVAAARNCGINATEEQARCGWENRSDNDAATACFPGATEDQMSCMLGELSRRVQGGLDGEAVDTNQYRYTSEPGSYISLGIGTMQGASCMTLFGESYETNNTCQADLSRLEGEIQRFGWSMLFRCQKLPDSGGYLITAENLCVDQPYRP